MGDNILKNYPKTDKILFREANRYLAGGVNSPVRSFKAVGGVPVFIERGQGSRIYAASGRIYLDYVMSWGALIYGHADRNIRRAIIEAARKGTGFGAPTTLETEFARELARAVPAMELTRLVNSGTEAVMAALRLARAFTGREKVIKFAGGYHGSVDYLFQKKNLFEAQYNDLDSAAKIVRQHYRETAAIIVEPVAANMGVVPPAEGFLAGLRKLSDRYGLVLIFDEVITGFRLRYGAAADLFGVRPDLITLGKIIGGGLPLAAYGGRKEIMKMVAPEGGVYQAGTLAGNPIAVSAGLAVLKKLRADTKIYDRLDKMTTSLVSEIRKLIKKSGAPAVVNRAGSLFTVFFSKGEVIDYESASRSDQKVYANFFHHLLERGVYFAPSPLEANFLSASHSGNDLKKTLGAIAKSLNRRNKK